ncbi:MAG TPA: hypothetical protein VEM95_00345, partial [Thermoplasmata archaeon]|nr:hypothetical protein [Thermoplasmata archaeon]
MVVLLASAFRGASTGSSVAPTSPPPGPSPRTTYTALPSADPDDGKFLAVAGNNLGTLAGISIILYFGIPAGRSGFEIGIFDGDTGNHWDTRQSFPVLNYRLYKDPLKSGSTTNLVASYTSEQMVDDDWFTKTFSTDSGARAPSGNYFYRMDVNWANSQSTSFNNFKVRTDGQISLRAGQEWGFSAGPQDSSIDPCTGTGDPHPGDQNDPDANSYDGDWSWYFYVPTELASITFRDGDFDRADQGGQPPDGPSGNGPCFDVPPSIYYSIVDPPANVYLNDHPSGNQVWRDFTIGPNAGDDYVVNYPLEPGLWRLHVQGMDAHNTVFLRASREVYSNAEAPLTVNPKPDVAPDNEATTRTTGVTMEYGHNVTNRGGNDSFDLKATSAHGWTTRIYQDVNGNGRRDANESLITQTPTLGTNESYAIVVQIDVPTGIPGRMDDVTTVLASSRNEWALQDDATDTTHVLA